MGAPVSLFANVLRRSNVSLFGNVFLALLYDFSSLRDASRKQDACIWHPCFFLFCRNQICSTPRVPAFSCRTAFSLVLPLGARPVKQTQKRSAGRLFSIFGVRLSAAWHSQQHLKAVGLPSLANFRPGVVNVKLGVVARHLRCKSFSGDRIFLVFVRFTPT